MDRKIDRKIDKYMGMKIDRWKELPASQSVITSDVCSAIPPRTIHIVEVDAYRQMIDEEDAYKQMIDKVDVYGNW